MDYDKLIERLKCPHIHRCPMYDEYPSCKACQKSIQHDAALAIETLRADLARVAAERDAAVADMEALMWFSGEGCTICAHAVEVHKEPYVRLDCNQEKGTGCSPVWRGIKGG